MSFVKHSDNTTALLARGGVIAYPTEAVWGLGCDPWNEDAVHKILTIKRRPIHKGLILVAAREEQVEPLLAPLTSAQRQTLSETWPGPVTWLIPDPEKWVPDWVRGEHSSVAVRISAHPFVQELCQRWGKPLVSTSANRAGEPALATRESVVALLGDEVDQVTAGETGRRTEPSRICDLLTGNTLRG